MPNPEKIIGKGFDNNPQNINKKGRNKKIYTILKEKGFSKDDIKTAFGEIAWYDLSELKKVHEDNKKPVIMRIVANQFYLALKKGDWNKIKEILEHTIGKPNMTVRTTIEEPITSIQLENVKIKDNNTSISK